MKMNLSLGILATLALTSVASAQWIPANWDQASAYDGTYASAVHPTNALYQDCFAGTDGDLFGVGAEGKGTAGNIVTCEVWSGSYNNQGAMLASVSTYYGSTATREYMYFDFQNNGTVATLAAGDPYFLKFTAATSGNTIYVRTEKSFPGKVFNDFGEIVGSNLGFYNIILRTNPAGQEPQISVGTPSGQSFNTGQFVSNGTGYLQGLYFTPNGSVTIAYSLASRSLSNTPWGVLQLGGNYKTIATFADGAGELRYTAVIPPVAAGLDVYVQCVDPTKGMLSNCIGFTIQ